MKLLTTQQAAAILGVTRKAVYALIARGRLPATSFGRDYAITEKAVRGFRRMKRGPKPKKAG